MTAPISPLVIALEDFHMRAQLLAIVPAPFWIAGPAVVVLAVGLWWIVLGLMLRRFTRAVQVVFRPFAERFDQRHATRPAIAELILSIVSSAVIAAAIAMVK